MRFGPTTITILPITIALAAGCGDDPAGPQNGDTLSAGAQVAITIMNEFANAPSQGIFGTRSSDSFGFPPLSLDTIYSRAMDCQLGGRKSVELRLHPPSKSMTDDDYTLETTSTLDFDRCAWTIFTRAGDRLEVTFTTDPTLVSSSRFTFSNGWSAENGTYRRQLSDWAREASWHGAFTWSTENGRSGRCNIDVTSEFSFDAETRNVSGHREGTICGRSVDRRSR